MTSSISQRKAASGGVSPGGKGSAIVRKELRSMCWIALDNSSEGMVSLAMGPGAKTWWS